MTKCECINWCSRDINLIALTGHHEGCTKGPDRLNAALLLIQDLCLGMERWAADEDGIHPDAWDIYTRAKALEGIYFDENTGKPLNRK